MFKIGLFIKERKECKDLETKLKIQSDKLKIYIKTQIYNSETDINNYLKNENHLDLIFIDIDMLNKSVGDIDIFINNEMKNKGRKLVFLSCHTSCDIRLYKLRPLDIILKPVLDYDILKILIKLRQAPNNRDTHFIYNKGKVSYAFPFDEILFFQSSNKKIIIIKLQGQEIFYGKLNNVLMHLPEEFIQIHQSYIINRNYIYKYKHNQVQMCNGDIINISRRFQNDLRIKVSEDENKKNRQC